MSVTVCRTPISAPVYPITLINNFKTNILQIPSTFPGIFKNYKDYYYQYDCSISENCFIISSQTSLRIIFSILYLVWISFSKSVCNCSITPSSSYNTNIHSLNGQMTCTCMVDQHDQYVSGLNILMLLKSLKATSGLFHNGKCCVTYPDDVF